MIYACGGTSGQRRDVELAGIEPATSCLQSRRSSQLSYSPVGERIPVWPTATVTGLPWAWHRHGDGGRIKRWNHGHSKPTRWTTLICGCLRSPAPSSTQLSSSSRRSLNRCKQSSSKPVKDDPTVGATPHANSNCWRVPKTRPRRRVCGTSSCPRQVKACPTSTTPISPLNWGNTHSDRSRSTARPPTPATWKSSNV